MVRIISMVVLAGIVGVFAFIVLTSEDLKDLNAERQEAQRQERVRDDERVQEQRRDVERQNRKRWDEQRLERQRQDQRWNNYRWDQEHHQRRR